MRPASAECEHEVVAPANYRDVGELLALWLDPSPIPPARLLRGGKLDALTQSVDIGGARTVINLRRGPDPTHLPDTDLVHLPAKDDVENYDTSRRAVRAWLEAVLAVLCAPTTRWPVYVHCTAGRDRTGVVIASALMLVDIPREVIVEEFMLSDGAERADIERALEGLEARGSSLQVDREALSRALGVIR